MTSVPADGDDSSLKRWRPLGWLFGWRGTTGSWSSAPSTRSWLGGSSPSGTLERPDEVRQSRIDPEVLLF